jgi:hypothetical protein
MSQEERPALERGGTGEHGCGRFRDGDRGAVRDVTEASGAVRHDSRQDK